MKIHPSQLSFVFILSWCFISVLFFISLCEALPTNPVSAHSAALQKYFPQGWGFFSKSPRDQTIYILDSVGKNSAVSWPNNSLKNLFGIYRYGRGQGEEAGLLVSQIDAKQWLNCDSFSKCLKEKAIPTINAKNLMPKPTLCGKFLFVEQTPVPWAWSKRVDKEDAPAKMIRVVATCSTG